MFDFIFWVSNIFEFRNLQILASLPKYFFHLYLLFVFLALQNIREHLAKAEVVRRVQGEDDRGDDWSQRRRYITEDDQCQVRSVAVSGIVLANNQGMETYFLCKGKNAIVTIFSIYVFFQESTCKNFLWHDNIIQAAIAKILEILQKFSKRSLKH